MRKKFVYKTTLIGISFMLSACHPDNSLKQVEIIGYELAHLDSITDFSSGRNQPVPKVENIGPTLYAYLRKMNQHELDHVGIEVLKTPEQITQRMGDGTMYKVVNHYDNNDSQRYYLFYSKRERIYKITGF
ncbi:MAG: hypothetical protein ACO1N0_18325 [Fluviicola sp.]